MDPIKQEPESQENEMVTQSSGWNSLPGWSKALIIIAVIIVAIILFVLLLNWMNYRM